MNEIQIRVTATGKHQCYRTVNGIYALDVGPAFKTPREAITYSDSPATRGADDHDSAGVWGAESGDGVRRPLGSPVGVVTSSRRS